MAASPTLISLMCRLQASLLAVSAGLAVLPRQAEAWGDEGHRIIGLIAEQYLKPGTRADVAAMLGADLDSLTEHDIASEATWADRYRDSDRDGSAERYKHTRRWHFVNIELNGPDLDRACFGPRPLPADVTARPYTLSDVQQLKWWCLVFASARSLSEQCQF
jgi:hypothetical protein